MGNDESSIAFILVVLTIFSLGLVCIYPFPFDAWFLIIPILILTELLFWVLPINDYGITNGKHILTDTIMFKILFGWVSFVVIPIVTFLIFYIWYVVTNHLNELISNLLQGIFWTGATIVCIGIIYVWLYLNSLKLNKKENPKPKKKVKKKKTKKKTKKKASK